MRGMNLSYLEASVGLVGGCVAGLDVGAGREVAGEEVGAVK